MMYLATAYMELGGQQLQINVVDVETLGTQRLIQSFTTIQIIRVAGYSAYFTQLGSDVQDEIIMRNEHTI